MAHKIVWGKELTEEQFFLQASPYSDDKTKKPSPDPLMILLDCIDEDGCRDVYSIVSLDKAQLEFYKRKENKDVSFLICHPMDVPKEFREAGVCASA